MKTEIKILIGAAILAGGVIAYNYYNNRPESLIAKIKSNGGQIGDASKMDTGFLKSWADTISFVNDNHPDSKKDGFKYAYFQYNNHQYNLLDGSLVM